MNRQGWIIGVAILAAVIGGVAYFASRDGGGEPGDTVPPITGPERAEEARGILEELERERRERAAEQGDAEPPRTAASADGSGAAAEPPPAASELDTAFERARAFRDEGQLADAQLLLFFAARQGHGPAAFELASMNDPLHHSPETSLLPEPDAFQAYRWYSVAREAGVAEAAPRLDALRTWATNAAEKGDSEAERLLLQWE